MKKLRFLYLAGVATLIVASSCSEEQKVMGGFLITPYVFILILQNLPLVPLRQDWQILALLRLQPFRMTWLTIWRM